MLLLLSCCCSVVCLLFCCCFPAASPLCCCCFAGVFLLFGPCVGLSVCRFVAGLGLAPGRLALAGDALPPGPVPCLRCYRFKINSYIATSQPASTLLFDTVAILAQGTHWAVTASPAFFCFVFFSFDVWYVQAAKASRGPSSTSLCGMQGSCMSQHNSRKRCICWLAIILFVHNFCYTTIQPCSKNLSTVWWPSSTGHLHVPQALKASSTLQSMLMMSVATRRTGFIADSK